MATGNFIRNGILAIGVAASLATASLGIGSAEARINGNPSSAHAQQCKDYQDSYDRAVRDFWNATTPEELLSARAELNIWMDEWKSHGCESDYGDIRFIVAGTNVAGNLDSGLTAQPLTHGAKLNPAGVQGTAGRR